MRHGIFPIVLAIALTSSFAIAGGKGRSGGGQGHGGRPQPSSAHASNASRPHSQGLSAPKPRARNAARSTGTAPSNHAVTAPGAVGTSSVVGGTLPSAPANSTSTPATVGTTPQSPLTATATSSLRVMMYGTMLPFGSNPGLALYHGYHASRNYHGNGWGNRGYGYRNSSMVNNRMRRLSRLVRDLNTLTVGYAASPNERNILRNDLMGVAQQGIRPPLPAVQQLSEGLISHLPDRRTPYMNTERLALDLEAVMNGSQLPPARVNQAIRSAQSILRSSGVPQAGIQALSADLKAVGFWRVAGNQAGFVR
jgi:hypothetical protein